MNAANEVAVQQFIDGRIGFLDIADHVENAMQKAPFIPDPTLEDLLLTDKTIRKQ
jgi:1-deoxy-D-xylulose-5-phosphate reductoisomerase